MKFGINCDVLQERFDLAQKLGYDYCEYPFNKLVSNDTETNKKVIKKQRDSAFPVTAANGFIIGLTLCGESPSPKSELLSYLRKGFDNSKELGIKTIVFGSGKARNCPEGFSREKTLEQLCELCTVFGDFGKEYDTDIVIEPLNHNETNIFTTVKETYAFVKKLANPRIKLLADSYHMRVENESFDTLKDYKEYLYHTHIAAALPCSCEVREIPSLEDKENIKEFIYALKRMGYDKCVSIEASITNKSVEEAMANAIKALHAWENADI